MVDGRACGRVEVHLTMAELRVFETMNAATLSLVFTMPLPRGDYPTSGRAKIQGISVVVELTVSESNIY